MSAATGNELIGAIIITIHSARASTWLECFDFRRSWCCSRWGSGPGRSGPSIPNALLGQQLISAVVSVAVGIILFEAGLGLKLSKLTGTVARGASWPVGRY